MWLLGIVKIFYTINIRKIIVPYLHMRNSCFSIFRYAVAQYFN